MEFVQNILSVIDLRAWVEIVFFSHYFKAQCVEYTNRLRVAFKTIKFGVHMCCYFHCRIDEDPRSNLNHRSFSATL